MGADDEVKRLFLAKSQELYGRWLKPDRYHRLMLAPILRQMLLDGEPLVDRVNRKHGLRIVFQRMHVGCPLEEGSLALTYRSVKYPFNKEGKLNLPPFAELKQGPRDEFLKYECLGLGATRITVRDIIMTAANVLGGVHYGEATRGKRKDEQNAVAEFGRELSLFGVDAPLRQLHEIAEIVGNGLMPLVEAVQGDLDGKGKQKSSE